MIGSPENGDSIFLFYREHFDQDFTYFGRVTVSSYEIHTEAPSKFKLQVGVA